MSENQTDTPLEMLREQEKIAEHEYHIAKADADRLIAIADARLTMIRELIEKLTRKPRGRPRKVDVNVHLATGGAGAPPGFIDPSDIEPLPESAEIDA